LKRSLLDTDTLSYYLKGHPQVVKQVHTYASVYGHIEFSIITYYEIKRGLIYAGATRKLMDFETLSHLSLVWELDQRSASESAAICSELWSEGLPLDDADVLIAGIARANQLVLVTNNTQHFRRIKDLDIVNWISD